jgi:glycosyltransferase involved in cell wall biosynthesis
VSRIEFRKNHFLLLKSFVELKLYEKGYFLVLLGHESIRAVEFNNPILVWGLLLNNVFISSEIDDNELYNFIMRMFCVPVKSRGFGIPPLEAAALKFQLSVPTPRR